MKYAIFYFSPTGGTKAVADIFSKQLGDAPMQEITTPSMDVSLNDDTLAFFFFPVYGGRIPKPMYDRMAIIKGNNTPCVPVAVFGNRAVDDALLEMSDLAKKQGFVTVAGAEIVAPHSIDPSFGAGRPDTSDRAKITEFINKLKAMESFKEVRMPGDADYTSKKVASLPLYPAPAKECIGCGICFKYCPAGAISEAKMKTKKNKCISCMRCVSMCSTDSRSVPKPIMLTTHLALKKMCSKRQEPKFYL